MHKAIAMAVAAAIATTASAADFPGAYPAAPLPYPTYQWVGPYLGLNVGYQWGSVGQNGADPHGLMGGVGGGYGWQTSQFVYGLEADLQLSRASDTFASYKFSNPWFGTLRARAGFALNNILFYGTLGFAYGRGRVEVLGLSEAHIHPGWAAGMGMEVGLAPGWTAKAEYLFIDLLDERYELTRTDHAFQSNLLRFGLNYRF